MTNSILAKQEDGTVQLTITIPASEVKKIYQEVLDQVAKDTQVAGFRKGKAPKKIVEDKADKTKIYEQVIQKIVPQAYLEEIKKHGLNPILSPKVELLKVKEDEDWEIRATTCERPNVELGSYKEEVRKTPSSAKIWTPETQKTQNKAENTDDEKTQKAIDTLLQTSKVNLSAILIEEELNRTLANLINQTEKLGLTIDQYLASINKSVEELRAEYIKRIENELRLQFSLDEIARSEKFEISEKEVDDLVAATGDDRLKENLNTPLQREYLKEILKRRKALDFLTNL